MHTIERNGNKISNIKEISRIYKNKEHASDKTQPSYVYLYSDNTSNTGVEGTDGQRITGTKGDLLFDTRVLTSPDSSEWVNWAAYYFEVPVNKGEFALGSVSKANKNGAYLRYLDIGAGNKDENSITIAKSISRPISIQAELISMMFLLPPEAAAQKKSIKTSPAGGQPLLPSNQQEPQTGNLFTIKQVLL